MVTSGDYRIRAPGGSPSRAVARRASSREIRTGVPSMPATRDRGEIIHYAGRHRLSPAVRDGVPALVGPAETEGRCGWERFFRALGARRLALELDGAGEGRLVPA